MASIFKYAVKAFGKAGCTLLFRTLNFLLMALLVLLRLRITHLYPPSMELCAVQLQRLIQRLGIPAAANACQVRKQPYYLKRGASCETS